MNADILVERLAEAVARASQYGPAGAEAAPRPPEFTIALSREVGARGTSVARVIGERLGWPVYDKELLNRVAEALKTRPHAVAGVDERPVSWLQEAVESFSTKPTVSEAAYVRHLVRTLQTLSEEGGCVIVGRGAAQVLPGETTLRVRLTAALKDRVAYMARHIGLQPEEAARYVTETDRARTNFVKSHFHKDPCDPAGYDLVLNMSRFSVEDAGELIVRALHALQARATRRVPATTRT